MSVSRPGKGRDKSREDAGKYARGVLRMHRDGFGFVAPETPLLGIDGDIFVPPDAQGDAMHGDRVKVRVQRNANRAEGKVVEVLSRGLTTVVGEFRRRRHGSFVKPHDDRIQHWIEIPEGMEIPQRDSNPNRVGAAAKTVSGPEELNGQIVNVQILDYPEKGDHPVGRVVEILGYPDDFGIDVEIVIRKHQIPHEFPEDVLAEARQVTAPAESEFLDREDFRGFDIVTIDGESARDFDDAVSVGRAENGNWLLQVHIADVSHYVRAGSAIDREARKRGTSVYFPDRAVPMLPVELSTDICSLRPQEDRLVFSALLEIDHDGETVGARFVKGVIRSAERLTYTRVHQELEADRPPLRYAKMRDLALLLNRKRTRRGSIDFDLPEALIEFDEFGEMAGVSRAPRNIAHRIIEEFMLAANEAVASHIERQAWPSLYRIHEQPDPRRIADFEEIAAHFGYSLGTGGALARKHRMVQRARDGRKFRRDVVVTGEAEVSPRSYQRLVAKLEGKPEERLLSYLMLRSLRQARYAAENVGHFALAAPSYTHFTSPIRRYPDLIVHRVLGDIDRPGESQVRELGDETSFTERRAAEAEREVVEWKKAKFMIDKIGDEFDGIIISVQKFGFFVELDHIFVEGLVPIDTLPNDRYRYQENSRRIVGERHKRSFGMGDSVRIQLVRVDASERRLVFALPQAPQHRRRR